MTKYDDIYEVAVDNYGLITSARAKELGVTNNELVQFASRGRIKRIGHGLYQLTKRTPETNDSYAIAVALAGLDAYLFGESVIAMHNLAPTNPKRIDVATPKRVRRKLPGNIRLTVGRPESDMKVYDGIPSQSVAAAIRSCKGKLMTERLRDATRNARREGLIRKGEEEDLLKELED
jgi:hypothetical protein